MLLSPGAVVSRRRTLLHTSIKAAIEAGHAKTVETEAMMRGSDGYLHIAGELRVKIRFIKAAELDLDS